MTEYEDNKIEDLIHKEVVSILQDYCKEFHRVLDLGSHNDWLADKIKYKQLHLVDKKFSNFIDNDHGDVVTFEMTIEKFIRLAKELGTTYDVIIMTSVIEHLNHTQKNGLLTSIKDLLNDGGIFVLGYPNARSLNRLLGVEMNLMETPYKLGQGELKVGHQAMYDWRAVYHFRFKNRKN